MTEASYDRQCLALHAAGFISADGATSTTFGCQMTRIALGTYAMVLSADAGLVNDEGFFMAVGKGLTAVNVVVQDTSNVVKTVSVLSGAGDLVDNAFEVALFRSVTK